MPANLIKQGESMAKSFPKINKAIEDAYLASTKAVNADQNSNTALNRARNVQTQLDTIVVKGDSSVEAAQARVDDDGNTFNTLKERLDTKEKKTVDNLNALNDWKDKSTINILMDPYNAKTDGVTDNTQAFTLAVQELERRGGGSIYAPKGDYIVNGFIELPSNVRFQGEQGTVFMKGPNATSVYMFVTGKTKGTKGYGGGAKNIAFSDIVFQGIAESVNVRRALSITLNHAENVQFFNCRFVNCITNGHAIDLLGCNDILVDFCTFEGAYNLEGREYTEAIQIDSSTSTSSSGDFTNYDSLPTKNVTVRNCTFKPSYRADGSVINWAPNPIGNHGFTGGKYYEGVTFTDNLIIDGWEQTGGNWRAWIHFYGLKDSQFVNNRFINSRGVSASALGFYASSSGRYNPTTGAAETGEPLPNKNIIITGNYFEGFNDTGANGGAIIRAYGFDYEGTSYRTVNFTISENQFTKNYGAWPNEGDMGRPLIQISTFSDIHIINNRGDLAKKIAYVYNGFGVNISGNTFTRIAQGGYQLQNVDRVVLQGNVSSSSRRPFELLECSLMTIKDNIFTNIMATANENYALKLRGLQTVILQGNVFSGLSGEGITNLVYLYSTASSPSSNIYTMDNLISGYSGLSIYTTGTITNHVSRNS